MKEVTLTALEPEDLEVLYTIENDQQQWLVSNTNVPYSRYALRDYISSQQHDIYADNQVRFVIRAEGKAIGLIDLFDFSPRHRRAEMGVAILKDEQGKGYAKEAILLLQQYCSETLGMHQIYCTVPADNTASIAMLKTTGFIQIALLSEWLKTGGNWQDALVYCYKF
jgi:diamine N-acetyltransferase